MSADASRLSENVQPRGLRGLTVPTFLGRTALAAEAGKKDTILVVVQLTGGNDGLNTVIPFDDAEYAKLRPTLKIPKDQVKKLNDRIGLHPCARRLAKLCEDGALCVVQGVGYPNPSQSHFRSMDIWQAASMAETRPKAGSARRSSRCPTPAFHVATKNEPSPLALAGAPVRVPSITSPGDFQLKVAPASGADSRRQKAIIEGAAQMPGEIDRAGSQAGRRVSARLRLAHRRQHLRQQQAPAGDRQELPPRSRTRRPASPTGSSWPPS